LVWVCLAIVVQILPPAFLPAFAAVLLLVAFKMHTQRLFALLRRTRWIFFSLLLIYAFATPGEALWSWDYAPTREGLLDGLLQLGRLACMLAGLSILLTLLSREQLIGGLYVLVYPVRYLGLSRERIAVRLALTLQYAENAMRDTAGDWRGAIEGALLPGAGAAANIELHVQPLGWRDIALLLLSAALLIGIWL
jgi:energy-coupling factor transport system permease protein